MKIGFSTCALNSGQTGVSTYIRELIRFLQLTDSENHYELIVPRNEVDFVPITNPNFVHHKQAPIFSKALLNLAWHNTALKQASKPYDVLHIPTARRIPLLKGTKVVATVHDLAAFCIEKKYDRSRMIFNRNLIPKMIRNTDHIIAVSEYTKQDIMRHTGYPEEQISVIYSGINKDLFRPVDPVEARERLHILQNLDKPFFIYVSRLEHPSKNHIRLIEAFERFKLENDSAHQLVLAGADWLGANRIRARAAQSPVKEDILFPGFVPLKSLPLLYSACDLMIFPSLFEGFGFPIIEALACGAPVACSNTSSMKEIARDVIPTFAPNSAEDIFRTMENILSRGWSEEQRAAGLTYANEFDWRKTSKAVVKIYQKVL